MAPRFAGLAVETRPELVDELSAELFELGATGIEQRDQDTHPGGLQHLRCEPDAIPPGGADPAAGAMAPSAVATESLWSRLRVSYGDVETPAGELRSFEARVAAVGAAAPPAAPGRVTVLAWFGDAAQAEQAWHELARVRPDLAGRLVELWGDEWRDRYRVAFQPFALTRTVTVVPPWAEPPPPRSRDERVLWMDPGRAFGTGLHATTGLVAGLLERRAAALAGQALLDVGTGSGILALVALLHGAARAVAIDVDADALEVARGNAARNGLSDRIDVSARTVDQVSGTFPWVVANIEARVLCSLADDLLARLSPGGTLLLSGLLEPQRDEVLARFARGARARGAELVSVDSASRVVDQDCWVVLALERKGLP